MMQTVTINLLGDGMIAFQIPTRVLENGLHLQPEITKPQERKTTASHDNLYFNLLKIGGHLRRKNGTFYTALLKEGFIQNGAVILIGTFADPKENPTRPTPCIRSIVQLDGNITCKLDNQLLSLKETEEILSNFIRIQQAIFKEFRIVSRAMLLGLTSIIALQASFFYFIFKIFQLFR